MKLKSNQPKACAEQVIQTNSTAAFNCPSSNGLRQMG